MTKTSFFIIIASIFILNDDFVHGWSLTSTNNTNPFHEQDIAQLNILKQQELQADRPEVIKAAFKHVRQNFMRYYANDDVYNLKLNVFKELLNSDDVAVPTEETVFNSVQKWIDVNKANRTAVLDTLIDVVRLPLLSVKFLTSTVGTYVDSCNRCRQMYLEAVNRHYQQKDLTSNNQLKHRVHLLNQPFLIGNANFSTTGRVMFYDSLNEKWIQFRLDIVKITYGVAFIDRKLLIIGGAIRPRVIQKTIESYDLTTGIISSMEPLPEPIENLATAVIGTNALADLYVIGGYNGKRRLKSLLKWDPILKRWFTLTPMTVARSSCVATVFNGKIYVAGGLTSAQNVTDILEVYSPKLNKWFRKSPMPSHKYLGGFAASTKYLYYIGGYAKGKDRKSSVERFDPELNTWYVMSPILSRGRVGAIFYNNSILVAGGSTTDVQMYDEQKETWRSIPSLHVNQFGCLIQIPWDVTIKF